GGTGRGDGGRVGGARRRSRPGGGGDHPAALQRHKLRIDLAVRRLPEQPDRLVHETGELIARRLAAGEHGQERVGDCRPVARACPAHASPLTPLCTCIHTRSTKWKAIMPARTSRCVLLGALATLLCTVACGTTGPA